VESWNFLTNHARMLLCIARDPAVRLRDAAASLGITERSATSDQPRGSPAARTYPALSQVSFGRLRCSNSGLQAAS